jgi:hypothetical protein
MSYQGLMVLGTEESSNQVRIMEKNTLLEDVALELPFQIKLNELSPEKFDSSFFIQLWKDGDHSGANADHEDATELIATIPLIEGKIHHVYNTNIYYRLNDFYPNFGFKYDYPTDTDTIAPLDPGVMLEMILPSGRAQLQLRTIVNNTLQEPHLNANLEFYWDRPEDINSLQEIKPSEWNKDEHEISKIIFIGSEDLVLYVFKESYIPQSLIRDEEYSIPGKEPMGFKFQFFFPDAKYMTAAPASLDEEIKNPVAKVEVWGTDWAKSELAYIYPSAKNKGGFFHIPKHKYSLGLATNYTKANRYITSDISLMEDSNEEIKRISLSKNTSITHQGYKLRHYKVQEDNPKSVILSVAYLPGYYLIIAGFVTLLASLVIWLIKNPTTLMNHKLVQ